MNDNLFLRKKSLVFLLLLLGTVSSCQGTSSSSSYVPSSVSYIPSSYSTEITGSTEFHLGTSTDPLYEEPIAIPLSMISIEMSKEYGDSTLFDYGNIEILVDGGAIQDGAFVKQALDHYVTDGVLEMLIVTHGHADHNGGLSFPSTWTNITAIDHIIDYGYDYGTNTAENYADIRDDYFSQGSEYHPITELIMHSTAIYTLTPLLSIQFLNTNCYVATGGVASDLNTTSICFALTFGQTVFFLNGDATGETDTGLRHNYPGLMNEKVVVAKAAHHASDSNGSNSSTFLRLFLKPDYVFVSAAITDVNSTEAGMLEPQHPAVGAINRFRAFTEQVFWNGTTGNLTVSCTAEGAISFSGKGRSPTNPYFVDHVLVEPDSEKDLPLFQTQWFLEYMDSVS